MESDTLVHLLAETLSCRAVGRVECGVVAVCAAAAADLSVTVRAGEAGVEDNLLKSLAVLAPEISDKGIVPFPVRKAIFLKIL
jgi:hypothetical protein